MQTTRTCSECHGTGKIIKEPCTTCRGKGTVRKQAKVTINIPAGIDDNQTLILKKKESQVKEAEKMVIFM